MTKRYEVYGDLNTGGEPVEIVDLAKDNSPDATMVVSYVVGESDKHVKNTKHKHNED